MDTTFEDTTARGVSFRSTVLATGKEEVGRFSACTNSANGLDGGGPLILIVLSMLWSRCVSTPASRELLGCARESGTMRAAPFPSGFCRPKVGGELAGKSAFKIGLVVAKSGSNRGSSGVGERGEFESSLSVSLLLPGMLITSLAMDGL